MEDLIWMIPSKSVCASVFCEELLEVIAECAGVAAADILDVDLCLMDSTPPCHIGVDSSFIHCRPAK